MAERSLVGPLTAERRLFDALLRARGAGSVWIPTAHCNRFWFCPNRSTMYEENLKPLPPGDAMQTFAHIFSKIQQECPACAQRAITHDQVLFWANTEIQTQLVQVSRRLLLPGSGISGIENLEKLIELAEVGKSCLICLNHRSNLDVPTLCALLHDQSQLNLFEKIIWIAGRKLQEDVGITGLLVQAFNRVMVTPRSWMVGDHTDEELKEAHLINIAAHRAIHESRHQGWVFALFPTGTRIRPGDVSTTRAIPETDTFLKSFEFLVLGHIDGCTLPVTRDQDLTHETPKLDRVTYTFGQPLSTDAWRAESAQRYPELDGRTASARAIVEDIAALGHTAKD